jgi:outer membrane protein assembly factor BamE (lipoprotein component of BamABCDE complex)
LDELLGKRHAFVRGSAGRLLRDPGERRNVGFRCLFNGNVTARSTVAVEIRQGCGKLTSVIPSPRPSSLRDGAVAAFIAFLTIVLWLVFSGDPVRDSVIGLLLSEDTHYAVGYSERLFRSVHVGMTEGEVRNLLGPPLGESWFYGSTGANGCEIVRVSRDVVVSGFSADECDAQGVVEGTAAAVVGRILGLPMQVCAGYTRGPDDSHYRVRTVCMSDGRVTDVIRRWYVD